MSTKETQYKRATLTIPQEVYKKARTLAAHQQKSLSRFVSDVLSEQAGIGNEEGGNNELPIGKYHIGIGEKVKRSNIYETYLERDISDRQ